MTAYLDTNVLIRHLTGDPPDQAAAATTFLRSASDLVLPDLIVAETIYVLESYYRETRGRIAQWMRSVVAFPAISVGDEQRLVRALEIYELDRIDFAEAYLVAAAESAGAGEVVSFDRSIDRVVTPITRVEPTI